MKLTPQLLIVSIVFCSCKEQEESISTADPAYKNNIQENRIPINFVDALNVLDSRYSEQ